MSIHTAFHCKIRQKHGGSRDLRLIVLAMLAALGACKERTPLEEVRVSQASGPIEPIEPIADATSAGADAAWQPLTEPHMPPRPAWGATAAHFVQESATLDLYEREEAVYREISQGNFPEFLRQLVPVTLRGEIYDENGERRTVTAIVRVMPDYLAIGSNKDYVRVPMNYYTATRLARDFGLVLPTDRIVDAVNEQAMLRIPPHPLPPTPEMVGNSYFVKHHQIVQEQLGRYPLGHLVSGIKKDVVLAAKLWSRPGRIVIYGWHNPDGQPIQKLSDAHHAGYADYSHGVRLVSPIVEIDGERRSLYELVSDWRTAPLFASEGRIANVAMLMRPTRQSRPPFDEGALATRLVLLAH